MLDPSALIQNPCSLISEVKTDFTCSLSGENPLANLMKMYPVETGLKLGSEYTMLPLTLVMVEMVTQ